MACKSCLDTRTSDVPRSKAGTRHTPPASVSMFRFGAARRQGTEGTTCTTSRLMRNTAASLSRTSCSEYWTRNTRLQKLESKSRMRAGSFSRWCLRNRPRSSCVAGSTNLQAIGTLSNGREEVSNCIYLYGKANFSLFSSRLEMLLRLTGSLSAVSTLRFRISSSVNTDTEKK